jgi:hypothetical protein
MQHPDRRRLLALSGRTLCALLAVGALGACGDDSANGDGGAGGASAPPSSSTSTVASTTSTGAATASVAATTGSGAGGEGGSGAGTGGAGDGGEGGAATYACADGSSCVGTLCSFDPPSETWSCVEAAACQEERRCEGECCPTGSRCEDGVCLLPDLSITRSRVLSSLEVESRTFGENACEILEGCVDAPGRRQLLRFDLKTPNDGEGDMFLGDPDENEDLFEFSSCHNHFHFTTYAAYRLLDSKGNVAATGHKQAFCLLDFEREDGDPNAVYECDYQGIQSGWSDIYDSYLPCQWVDITDVPPGDYSLEIQLNTDHVLIESDYENNGVVVPVTIEPDSCPNGCSEWDDDVCQPGDPQGRAENGICDCDGIHAWDVVDCSSCTSCTAVSCAGGCSAQGGLCCGLDDACDNADNGVCDCGGTTSWDDADCATCVSADPECPQVDSCPNGCGFDGNQCHGFDAESILDGWCDCTDEGWDTIDCFSCTSNCGQD